MKHQGLVVVVPVLNEERLITQCLDRLAAMSTDVDLRGIVIVDDGSTDRSVAVVREFACATVTPIRLVRLSRNFGHQSAVMVGVKAALHRARDAGAEWIGVIDADLQDAPEHFRDLLERGHEADVVYAVRSTRGDGWLMRAGTRLFYSLLSRTSRFPIPRQAGTFCIMRLAAAEALQLAQDGEPYFPGLRAWIGFRQTGVPCEREARREGRSRVGLAGLLSLSLRALLLYSRLPYDLMLWLGAAILVVTLVASAALVGLRLLGYITIPGATTIVVLILLSLGIQVVFFGILGHMVSRGLMAARVPAVVMDETDLP